MKKNLFLPALVAGLALTFTSCQKDENEQITPVIVENNIDSKLEETALALAKSLNNKEFRVAFKTEALKKFDGDYNILYKKFKEVNVAGYSVQERIALGKNNINPAGNMKINTTAAVAELNAITNVDKLQFSVPVNCDEWDAGDFTPLVAVVPQDFQEGVTKQLKAYDHEGNIHMLDAKIAPDFPVVVVTTSERTDVEGNVDETLITPDNARTPGLGEYMHKIKCPDISAIEAWALGAPELEYYVTGTKTGTPYAIESGSYYKPGKRNDIDNKWVTLDRWIFTWNRPDYDDYIAVKWIELDDTGALNGIVLKWTTKFKLYGAEQSAEVSYDFSKVARHDDGGTKTVWQGEAYGDYGQEYNTGRMAWRMNSK